MHRRADFDDVESLLGGLGHFRMTGKTLLNEANVILTVAMPESDQSLRGEIEAVNFQLEDVPNN